MSGRIWVGQPRENLKFRNYFNPFIWIVPGGDPYGDPGNAEVGHISYVWTRILNTSEYTAERIAVEFFYCRFSMNPSKRTAQLIGRSYVDLIPGAEEDVLCLSPFIPKYAGPDGCIIVVAKHSIDPLPSDTDDYWFWYGALSQVGQRNITVVEVGEELVAIPIEVPYNGQWDNQPIKLKIIDQKLEPWRIDELVQTNVMAKNLDDGPQVDLKYGLSLDALGSGKWAGAHELVVDFSEPDDVTAYLLMLNTGTTGERWIEVRAYVGAREIGGVAILAKGM